MPFVDACIEREDDVYDPTADGYADILAAASVVVNSGGLRVPHDGD